MAGRMFCVDMVVFGASLIEHKRVIQTNMIIIACKILSPQRRLVEKYSAMLMSSSRTVPPLSAVYDIIILNIFYQKENDEQG
jgi:hypothetical protein